MDESSILKKNKAYMLETIDFFVKINHVNDAALENHLQELSDIINPDIVESLIQKVQMSEDEKFFLSTFIPAILKKFMNGEKLAKHLNNQIRTIIIQIVNITLKHFENPKIQNLLETVVECYSEEKSLNKYSHVDLVSKFLVRVLYFRISIINIFVTRIGRTLSLKETLSTIFISINIRIVGDLQSAIGLGQKSLNSIKLNIR